MALVNKNTGKYIKVIRDRTVITPNSFQVSFYEFESKEDKELYFKREKDISSFLAKGDLKAIELQKQIDELATKLGESGSAELKKKMDFLNNFILDLSSIRFDWAVDGIKDNFKTRKLLDELGFDKDWFTPLKSWGIGTVNTGIFTNQTFSYECLYKELKKIFSNDFIDC